MREGEKKDDSKERATTEVSSQSEIAAYMNNATFRQRFPARARGYFRTSDYPKLFLILFLDGETEICFPPSCGREREIGPPGADVMTMALSWYLVGTDRGGHHLQHNAFVQNTLANKREIGIS